MLKRRLIPVLNIMNGLIVRSEKFSIHQNIGNIINQASRYNEWEVDELVYLDITRAGGYDMRRDDHKIGSYDNIEDIVSRISKVCFMPLAFGGGIRTIEDVDARIQNGADKIIINTAALDRPDFIGEIAKKYGSQAVVVSMDYKMSSIGPEVFSKFGQVATNLKLEEWALRCQNAGAGELFMNSIDRDGRANGFDIETINLICNKTSIPVIACGGAGDEFDFVDVANQTNVSGIAGGNYFHFTERSYPRLKKLMKEENVNVR